MAEEMANAKPQCGGGAGDAENYDLPLHVAAVFVVLAASLAGAGFPVVAKRVSWMKIPPNLFFACKHFGTGVLIATAFVHLIPTAFQSLNNPCLPDLLIKDYPAMPGVIMMAALFALFVIEVYLKGKTGGHSHGGPTGGFATQAAPIGISAPVPPSYRNARPISWQQDGYPDEKDVSYERNYEVSEHERRDSFDSKQYGPQAEMPPWFQAFFARYVRQREELKSAINTLALRSGPPLPPPVSYMAPNNDALVLSEPEIDEATYKKMSLNITLLEGGILFHSVFVGMTISITTDGFIILLIAIVFHQFFEGLGLGSRIAAVTYPKGTARPWILVAAFGTTAPIGQSIGLVTRGAYDPDSAFALILVGVFNAISSGLLIYAATVDLLAEDFLSDEAQHLMTKSMKIKAFCYVLLGAAGMSVVGAFA
ncbi:zinc-regulated transporter 2 [Amylocarpus encephaloides]|uniref:Zinc-regulated transporter 2 n=1 Tax=Amylocarpus encephaloides TaxID=45428 RepID=A0A9P7YCW9_9HELO|nr:zinc-regulated transporter 2 [Amylocarpus encephaloides]